jgi:hypothetical protein
MKILARSLFAWVVAGLGIALYVAGQVISYASAPLREQIYVLVPLAALLVGGLIAVRLPGNIYGWLWLMVGWGTGVFQTWGTILARLALGASPPRLALAGIAVEIAEAGWLMTISMTSMTILLFPTGRLPSPRWRTLVWIVGAAGLLAAFSLWAVPGQSGIAALIERPFGIQGSIGQMAEIIAFSSTMILFIALLPATLSLVFRYRRAAGQERTQLRWLAYAAALNIGFFIIDAPNLHQAWVSEETMSVISNALLLCLPLSVAIAILRYHLYDIDVIIRKTLVYGVLTASLALVFFGGVALLQQVIGRISGTEDSPVVIVISTLTIAALFAPLRRRIQDFIDRRFYRSKYNAEQALEEFAATARDETDLEALTGKLVELISQTIHPNRVDLWFTRIKGNR